MCFLEFDLNQAIIESFWGIGTGENYLPKPRYLAISALSQRIDVYTRGIRVQYTLAPTVHPYTHASAHLCACPHSLTRLNRRIQLGGLVPSAVRRRACTRASYRRVLGSRRPARCYGRRHGQNTREKEVLSTSEARALAHLLDGVSNSIICPHSHTLNPRSYVDPMTRCDTWSRHQMKGFILHG